MTILLGLRIRMSKVKKSSICSARNSIVEGRNTPPRSDQCEGFVTSICTISTICES